MKGPKIPPLCLEQSSIIFTCTETIFQIDPQIQTEISEDDPPVRYRLALRFLDGVAILCITEEGWESSEKVWSRIELVLERGRNQRFVDLNRRSGL